MYCWRHLCARLRTYRVIFVIVLYKKLIFFFFTGEEISRSYTPIPSKFLPKNESSSPGDVCLMIKKYAQGMLTPIICSSKKGDVLELSNPLGSFEMRIIENKEMYLMIAAGTGITPLLGLLNCVLERRSRKW